MENISYFFSKITVFSEPFLITLIVTALYFFFTLFSFLRSSSFRHSLKKFVPPKKHYDCVCSCNVAVLNSDSASATVVPYLSNSGGSEMLESNPPLALVVVVLAERRTGSSMMEELVLEITTHALDYLDYLSLCRLSISMTNSLMRKSANDDNAWKALYHKWLNSMVHEELEKRKSVKAQER